MDVALLLSALLLGLAGAPHCVVMCAAPCAAATGTVRGPQGRAVQIPPRVWLFHLMRILSYAAVGAVAASSVGALSALGQVSPALRPLWTLLHAGAFVLGLWLLWQGRQPAWLENLGRGGQRLHVGDGGWQRMSGPARAGVAGALWAAWPCGLLQSALVMAALANGPVGGAMVMVGFGAVTALGLTLGPALWSFLGSGAASAGVGVWAVRAAGAMLAAASGWALTHGLWARVVAYCFG